MLLTKSLIKFNKLLVKIPKQTKRIWDLQKIDGDINFFLKIKFKYQKMNGVLHHSFY